MLDLDDILLNRAWLWRNYPFTHVVARNVFKHAYYQSLATWLRERLTYGLSELPALGQFSRSIPGYDAYGIGLSSATAGPAEVFLSAAWRDMMCGLFGIGRTPYMYAGAHLHAPGSRNGFIHNDFNPVWFPHAKDIEIRIPQPERCEYKTGAGPCRDSDKVQVVRGAVVIFFLLNDGWHCGDGGETGLYASPTSSVSEPAVRCPPENNSLLAFECSPFSFHAFMTNKRLPRTSIIVWVHRTLEEATEKYGKERLEHWKT
jgi:hypothetical protein